MDRILSLSPRSAILPTIIVSLVLALVVPAESRPKERFDHLKSQLIQNVKAKNHSEVIRLMDEMRKLGVPLSDAMFFIEGRALLRSGKPGEAKIKLKEYINKVGLKGKFYKLAHRLLGKAKTRQREAAMGGMTEEEKKRFALELAERKADIAKCDKQYKVCARLSQRAYKEELDAQLSTETKVKTAGARILECRAVRNQCYVLFED